MKSCESAVERSLLSIAPQTRCEISPNAEFFFYNINQVFVGIDITDYN